jgi:photosystem II stability/assembly factor-like uncharacterized protein
VAYRNGQWRQAGDSAYDLIGLSVTKDGIYSSGHGPSDGPVGDPIGLVKSTDGGKSWRRLTLAGEAEFHVMDVSFRSGAIYVLNVAANSQMSGPGVYFSRDDGKSWKRCTVAGLAPQIVRIAAHPLLPSTVAVATENGIYISHDFGEVFHRIGPSVPISAITFDVRGDHLFFALDDPYRLLRISLDGITTLALSLPKLEETSFVKFIAQNRSNLQQLAIATRRKNVFQSHDGGATWKHIMRYGP